METFSLKYFHIHKQPSQTHDLNLFKNLCFRDWKMFVLILCDGGWAIAQQKQHKSI